MQTKLLNKAVMFHPIPVKELQVEAPLCTVGIKPLYCPLVSSIAASKSDGNAGCLEGRILGNISTPESHLLPTRVN